MQQRISGIRVWVNSYDDAVDFYVNQLGFTLVEDTPLGDSGKRWVLVAPPGSTETRILLALAKGENERALVGKQAGDKVFLFLHTDDFQRDYQRYREKGVSFRTEPVTQPYGTVAVFEDLYGNGWDLIGP